MGAFLSHTSFVIERDLPGGPSHAFRFWAERDLKRQWTSCHPDWTVLEDRFDFQIGGAEVIRWCTAEGAEHDFHAHYLDIVPGRQIIYAYAMRAAARQVSASLVSVEFTRKGKGALMTYTEQAAFQDEADAAPRRSGTGAGFERLIVAIERSLATAQ